MSARNVLLAIAATAVAAEDTLVISVGTQNGFFKSNPDDPANSGDIGPMK